MQESAQRQTVVNNIQTDEERETTQRDVDGSGGDVSDTRTQSWERSEPNEHEKPSDKAEPVAAPKDSKVEQLSGWIAAHCGIDSKAVTTYAEALVGEGVDQPSDLAELNDGDWPESIKTLHRKKIKAAVAKGGFDLPEPEGAMGQDDKVSPTRPGTNADVDTEELELAEAIQRSLNMARVETNVQEDVELGLEPSAARVETETNAQQAEELTLGQTLRVALETNRNMARVHPEERMAAARAESSHIDLAEPPLKTPEDFRLWYAWAKEHTDQHRRMVHPREYDQRGRPSDKPLSLWTSRREIGRQFGAGVELYLELLDLCLKGCLLGAAVYAYSLYLNLEQGLSMEVMDGFTGEMVFVNASVFDRLLNAQGIWGSLPLQLAQTSAGARIDCDDDHCRLANTITALVDCSLTILLLLLLSPKLRRHVEAVTRRVDQHRVTVADYSIELRRLPETVTQDQVRQTVGRTLKRHAEARLQHLEQKEAAAITRTTSLSRMQRPVQLRSLQREVSLLHGAVEQVQRFIAEEKWRVHEDGVTLCLRNGRLLSRAQQKVPLLHQIELHQKGDERIKALRRGPPSCWERLGDWRRARKLRKEQARLKATSAELLHELHNASDAQRVVSAIVTFEEEEGRLEALHAFPPLGLGSCPTGAPVAKEAPEPSDRLLHNLEHRGSFGNLARALFSLAAQLVVVGASFAVLSASQNVDQLLTANSTSSATSSACGGISMLWARGNEEVTNRIGNGGDDTGALAGEEAGSGGGTEDVSDLCLGLSTQVLAFLPVIVSLAVNNILFVVVDVLARLQRPGCFRRLTYIKASNIFIFQLVNTGLTPLLVALFSVRSQRNSQREKEASVPEYDYQLDTAWYELASSAVLLTMTALWLSLGSWPFVASLFDTMRRRKLAPKAVTAHGLRVLHTGPPFRFALRVGSALSVAGLALAYGPGMPLAWILGACYFLTAIVTQRWALLRLHRLPELAFDAKVMKAMIKKVKYMLLLHMFAAYITFRPLPCASLRELHASFLSELRSQSWFLPLVSEDSPWLIAEAFVGAEATNTTNTTAPDDESSASSNSISIGAFVLLLGLGLAISGILLVCLCDCTCVQLCKGARRRLQVLKHDVVSSHDVSRSPEEFAEMRVVYERKLQLATELGNLEGLPPLSAALAGTEHPALRRMPKTGAFVHLNEVTWRRGWSLLCMGGDQSVPWYAWQTAKRTATHIAGVRTYKPPDHPHYKDACEVIVSAEQKPRPEEAEARRGRTRLALRQTRAAD